MIRMCMILLAGLCACSAPQQSTHYSDEQLATLFMDIHVAKAAIQNAEPRIRDSLYDQYYLQICEIHGVHPDSLRLDMDLLTANPDRMEPIYSRVVDSLEQITLKNRAED